MPPKWASHCPLHASGHISLVDSESVCSLHILLCLPFSQYFPIVLVFHLRCFSQLGCSECRSTARPLHLFHYFPMLSYCPMFRLQCFSQEGVCCSSLQFPAFHYFSQFVQFKAFASESVLCMPFAPSCNPQLSHCPSVSSPRL